MDRAALLSGQVPSHERKVPRDWVAVVNREEHAVNVKAVHGGYDITYNDEQYHVLTDWKPGEPLVRATVNGDQVCFQMDRAGAGYSCSDVARR